MTGLNTILIVVGLFLLAVIFVKQKMPASLIVLLSISRRDVSDRGRHEAGGVELTAPKNVVVFDYGFGNARRRACPRAAGAEVEITRDFDKAMNADWWPVPGVGAFAACMKGLKDARGDWIIGRRLSGGRPVMGICVGMQILFARGIEHGVETRGPRRVARHGRAAPGRHRAPHGLEHRRGPGRLPALRGPRRRRALLLRALLRRPRRLVPGSGQPGAARPPVTWSTHGQPFAAAVETAPCGPRSSTPRSPATPEPSSSPTGSEHESRPSPPSTSATARPSGSCTASPGTETSYGSP